MTKRNPNKMYRKKTLTQAELMNIDFIVETLEGTMKGKAGDYLATGVLGEKYIITKKVLEASFEEVKNLCICLTCKKPTYKTSLYCATHSECFDSENDQY